jgi:hypothetical protein
MTAITTCFDHKMVSISIFNNSLQQYFSPFSSSAAAAALDCCYAFTLQLKIKITGLKRLPVISR